MTLYTTGGIVNWLMTNMSCKRFAQFVANGEIPLGGGPYRQFHFWLHWAICPFCRQYWREIKAISVSARSPRALKKLSAVKIAEIKKRLRGKLIQKNA